MIQPLLLLIQIYIFINTMSGKRPAEQSLNQKTLNYEPNKEDQPVPSDAPRTVVTVQRNEEGPVVKKDPQELPKNTNETPQDPPKETQEKPKPLFADLFQNKQGMGIFTAAKKGLLDSAREEPKIDYKAPNLFNNNGFKTETNKQSSGLFGNKNSSSLFQNNNGTSLFGNNNSATAMSNPSSIFGSKTGGGSFGNSGGSIFNFQQGSIPPVRFGEEAGGDEEGDSAELQQGQEMKVDKSKSKVKFEYTSEIQVLFSGLARKYKLNNGDLMEGVEVVLQYDPETKLSYLVVRLMATKHTIFTGFVLKDKSEVRVLNKKEQNLQIAVFSLGKDKPPQLNRLKIMLQSPQKGQGLKTLLEQIIKGELVVTPEKEVAQVDNNDLDKKKAEQKPEELVKGGEDEK